jgi:hypothetical protein
MAYLYGEDEELQSLYGPSAPAAPQPPPSARDQLRDLEVQGPPEQPRPKWWQRALAGVAAGAQGYVNAGGRVNIPQEQIDATTEGIMAPGYRRKLGEFQSRKEGLQQVASMERQDEQDAMRRSESEARIASEQAQMEAARAAAARANRPTALRAVTPPSTEEARLVRILDDPDALPEAKEAAQKRLEALNAKNPAAAPRETPTAATQRRSQEADAQGLKGRDRTEFILTGRLPKPPKPVGIPQQKPATRASFGAVEARKQRALAAAETRFRDARNLMLPEDLEAEKQRIQDGYEAEIEALGGASAHSDVSTWDKPATPPPAAKTPDIPPPPPPGAIAKYREKETGVVRRFKDVTPEEHADAYRKGYELVP